MPTRPLLRLPTPSSIALPSSGRGGAKIRFPSKGWQKDLFGPIFNRLRSVLSQGNGAIQLRDDPSSLAPERVIVFEIAGTVANFLKAVARIPGLEFMAEYETDFASDEHFVMQKTSKDKVVTDRPDKAVPGRFYLAMPDMAAFANLLSLWDRWENDRPLGRGYTPLHICLNNSMLSGPGGLRTEFQMRQFLSGVRKASVILTKRCARRLSCGTGTARRAAAKPPKLCERL